MADYMSLRRFKDISLLLKISMEAENDIAAVEDRFNEHMEKVYAPSGTVCLDESMVKHTTHKHAHSLVQISSAKANANRQ
jgi:hypothetical protein